MIDYLQKSKTHLFVDALEKDIEIEGDEAHHIMRVLRLRMGDKVTCASDGNIREYEIVEFEKTSLKITATKEVQEVKSPEITLIISLFKLDRLELAISKAVEAGASEIILTKTQYSNINIDKNREKVMNRFEMIIKAAGSQSRRSLLTKISFEPNLSALITKYENLVICDPEGSTETPKAPTAILIGPEGGFGPNDMEVFKEIEKWKISDNILRAETAAVVSVALVSYCSNK